MEESKVKGYLCFMYEYSGGFRYQFSRTLEDMLEGRSETIAYKKKVTASWCGQITEHEFSEDYEKIFFSKKLVKRNEKVMGNWPNETEILLWKQEGSIFSNKKKSLNSIKNIKLENSTLSQLSQIYASLPPTNKPLFLAKVVEKLTNL